MYPKYKQFTEVKYITKYKNGNNIIESPVTIKGSGDIEIALTTNQNFVVVRDFKDNDSRTYIPIGLVLHLID